MPLASTVRLLSAIGLILIFIASQLFWVRRVGRLGAWLIANPFWRKVSGGAGLAAYVFLFVYNLVWIERGPTAVRLTVRAALVEAPPRWWVASSVLGFILIVGFAIVDRSLRAAVWAYRRTVGARHAASLPNPTSPSRRCFLEQTAVAVSAAPFVACAYGLFYSRLNLEITHQRIKLWRLPKAFEGFRIAQLSDIHIGPFMPAEEIRKYVAIASQLKPDLVVLTGDFVTWDGATQGAVVKALAGLRAPFGIFGCLGNHEIYTETQDSITRLFAAEAIGILRHARVPLQLHGEALNLIGIDFQGRHGPPLGPGAYLRGVERLVLPDTVNILLSHNPNTFDRAAELGIDLSLAGHTHGGQVALEFVHRHISPSRLVTDYIKGWFRKPDGAQLYVNRGIGTIGIPIRLNAPPEITLFELVRGA